MKAKQWQKSCSRGCDGKEIGFFQKIRLLSGNNGRAIGFFKKSDSFRATTAEQSDFSKNPIPFGHWRAIRMLYRHNYRIKIVSLLFHLFVLGIIVFGGCAGSVLPSQSGTRYHPIKIMWGNFLDEVISCAAGTPDYKIIDKETALSFLNGDYPDLKKLRVKYQLTKQKKKISSIKKFLNICANEEYKYGDVCIYRKPYNKGYKFKVGYKCTNSPECNRLKQWGYFNTSDEFVNID